MGRQRPTIAVTGPDRGGLVAWLFTRRAIRAAGGRAVWIRPKKPRREVVIHGLVVGGGADVDPRAYGEEPVTKPEVERLSRALGWLRVIAGFILAPLIFILRWIFSRKAAMGADASRDEIELELLDRAARTNLPVLGICRGAQLINVHQGGTLHRDLADFYTEHQALWTVLPRKRVQIEPGSILATTTESLSCWVNSLHRQAVAELGKDLRISAHERGGVVQAIEHGHRLFWIGVQWHPEYMPQQEEQRRLFEVLVRQAAQALESRSRPASEQDSMPAAGTRTADGKDLPLSAGRPRPQAIPE